TRNEGCARARAPLDFILPARIRFLVLGIGNQPAQQGIEQRHRGSIPQERTTCSILQSGVPAHRPKRELQNSGPGLKRLESAEPETYPPRCRRGGARPGSKPRKKAPTAPRS